MGQGIKLTLNVLCTIWKIKISAPNERVTGIGQIPSYNNQSTVMIQHLMKL